MHNCLVKDWVSTGMWSAALCTLGVSKPIWGCNCLNFRQGMNSVVTEYQQTSCTHGLKLFVFILSLFQESRGKRPLKIWDSWRNVRKGLVVGSFEELIVRGKCNNCCWEIEFMIPSNLSRTFQSSWNEIFFVKC